MQLDIVIGFFVMGALAKFAKSDLAMPSSLYKSCTIFLLLAIGLKGGHALAASDIGSVLSHSVMVIAFGAMLPFIAYPILYYVGRFNRQDAASIAAHYGSVSVATYAVAVSVAESLDIYYEPYLPLFVALLEVPAIFSGLFLAKPSFWQTQDKSHVLREIFLNQGVVLLVGGILIGVWGGDRVAKIMPFLGDLFSGVLALFMLEMGRQAASRIKNIKESGFMLISFGVLMPLIGASLAWLLASYLALSAGGTFLLMVLGSSASYIAVPAAMKSALPEANEGLSITASLAITFPFNVLVAIPIYLELTKGVL